VVKQFDQKSGWPIDQHSYCQEVAAVIKNINIAIWFDEPGVYLPLDQVIFGKWNSLMGFA
jgi:hypothetical protein